MHARSRSLSCIVRPSEETWPAAVLTVDVQHLTSTAFWTQLMNLHMKTAHLLCTIQGCWTGRPGRRRR